MEGVCTKATTGNYITASNATATCASAITNCATCEVDGSECLTCDATYYLSSTTTCTACTSLSNCVDCTDADTCTECAATHFPIGGVCTLCSSVI